MMMVMLLVLVVVVELLMMLVAKVLSDLRLLMTAGVKNMLLRLLQILMMRGWILHLEVGRWRWRGWQIDG